MARPIDDYHALREDSGVLDLAGWCLLRLHGPDAREFLQGLSSQDVARVVAPDATMSLFLTEKGRPMALAWVSSATDGATATVIADESARETLRPHFERFRVMEDVEFEGPDGMPRVFGVAGPRRASRLLELAASIPGAGVVHSEPLSFLLVPLATEASRLPAAAHPEAAEAWRIAAGLPRGGVDYTPERLATELSLPEAISFDKGCYVGQEVVARTAHRGQVRRRRVGFRFPWEGSALPAQTPIHAAGADAPSGFVTSTASEPGTGQGLGMGYLSSDALVNPADLTAIHVSQTTPVTVGGWPL